MTLALHTLHPHPSTVLLNPNPSLKCRATRHENLLLLHYCYEYPQTLGALEYVEHKAHHFHATLWQKTCFEFFLRDCATGRYWEWNFLPSGAWWDFAFESERRRSVERDVLLEAAPFGLTTTKEVLGNGFEKLHLEVQLDIGFSPALLWHFANQSSHLKASYTAVIAHHAHPTQYWAARHAQAQKPDFHSPAGFVDFNF